MYFLYIVNNDSNTKFDERVTILSTCSWVSFHFWLFVACSAFFFWCCCCCSTWRAIVSEAIVNVCCCCCHCFRRCCWWKLLTLQFLEQLQVTSAVEFVLQVGWVKCVWLGGTHITHYMLEQGQQKILKKFSIAIIIKQAYNTATKILIPSSLSGLASQRCALSDSKPFIDRGHRTKNLESTSSTKKIPQLTSMFVFLPLRHNAQAMGVCTPINTLLQYKTMNT